LCDPKKASAVTTKRLFFTAAKNKADKEANLSISYVLSSMTDHIHI
jgi:hypothetical protein